MEQYMIAVSIREIEILEHAILEYIDSAHDQKKAKKLAEKLGDALLNPSKYICKDDKKMDDNIINP